MKVLLTLIATFTITFAHAQIFGRIVDRAKDKISNKLEDKVVERISEEIARAAMKPIDNAIDDMLKERHAQDSINGKTDVDYGEFVNAFLKPVNLPDSYTFDMTLECETKDYDGDKTDMEMLLTKDGSAIGFVQFENGRDQMPKGMTLKSESKTKSKNKKSKFEVKKVIDSAMTINNKDYKQETYATED